MATLTQQKVVPAEQEFTPAEQALIDAFEEHLATLPADKQKAIRADLRANAVAHGE
jgi:hypothetical protein